MLLLLTTVLLLKRYGTQAVPLPAPTPTSSTFDAPIFARDNPSDGCHSRTVLDILWSCLATTFACTWVSVHPNVPWRNEGKWSLLGRRIYLMFFSILAPEFMIVWAFKQWRGAVMIREAVNKASEKAFPDTEDPRRKSWTTTHGHLLQMGGFRVSCTPRESNLCYIRNVHCYRRETSEGTWATEASEGTWDTDSFEDDENNNTVNDNTIWEGVLTIDALKTLLSKNLIRFPTITEDEINDRSKGDALSKGIALLQLTWFIVQIITRHAQGLAITELELTTAALAGLNSVMYIFWWSKPRDVRFPVVIRTKAVEKLLAERTEDSTWSFSAEEFDFRKYLLTSMSTSMKEANNTLRTFLVSFFEATKNTLSDLASAISTLPGHLCFFLSLSYQSFVKAIGDVKRRKSGDPKRTDEKGSSNAPADADPETDNEDENVSRKQQLYMVFYSGAVAVAVCFVFLFSLLAYAINFGIIVPISQIMQSDDHKYTLPMVFDETEPVRVLYMMFYSEDAVVQPLFITASIAGALFGGVHCLAWHFSFPSHVEQIMWRTASLGIVGACAWSFLGTYIAAYDIVVFELLANVLLFPTAAVYPVFRLMLLVLAVTSLRSLPPSAFDTVQWIEFVPHI